MFSSYFLMWRSASVCLIFSNVHKRVKWALYENYFKKYNCSSVCHHYTSPKLWYGILIFPRVSGKEQISITHLTLTQRNMDPWQVTTMNIHYVNEQRRCTLVFLSSGKIFVQAHIIMYFLASEHLRPEALCSRVVRLAVCLSVSLSVRIAFFSNGRVRQEGVFSCFRAPAAGGIM